MHRVENDNVLIKYIRLDSDDNEHYVGGCRVAHPDEFLNMLIIAYKNEVQVSFNEYSTIIPSELLNDVYYIEDIIIGLGTEEDLMTMEVYIR